MRGACRDHGAGLLVVSHDQAVIADFDQNLDLAELNRASKCHGGQA